jgi:hypothetical protein
LAIRYPEYYHLHHAWLSWQVDLRYSCWAECVNLSLKVCCWFDLLLHLVRRWVMVMRI